MRSGYLWLNRKLYGENKMRDIIDHIAADTFAPLAAGTGTGLVVEGVARSAEVNVDLPATAIVLGAVAAELTIVGRRIFRSNQAPKEHGY